MTHENDRVGHIDDPEPIEAYSMAVFYAVTHENQLKSLSNEKIR